MHLVNRDAYVQAAQLGLDAVPAMKAKPKATVSADDIADEWIAHVNPYAQNVPGRLAQSIAQFAGQVDPDELSESLDDKLEALRSQITRYADPPWGAGNQGYGEALDANDVLMEWELEDGADHCSDCVEIAAGSPYERGDLPTWPGLGETQCFANCKCSIVAEADSFAAAFGGSD